MLPPLNWVMRPGRTGIMIPTPTMRSTRETKMKPTAGLRAEGESIAPILHTGRRFGKLKSRSVLQPLQKLVDVHRERRSRLDVERLAGALHRDSRVGLHVRLRQVLREGDHDLV